MSDHEFEKQVQRKLDELRLRPSNAVWTAIEQDIRQHKPRRRFGFWLPLGVVALAVTGYIFYATNQNDRASLPLAKSKSINVTPSTNSYSNNNSTQHSVINNDNSSASAEYPAPGSTPASTNAGSNNTTSEGITPSTGEAITPSKDVTARSSTGSNTDATKHNITPSNDITATSKTASIKPAKLKPGSRTPQQHRSKRLAVQPAARAHETTSSFDDMVRLPDAVTAKLLNLTEEPEEQLLATAPHTVSNITESIATEKATNDSLQKTLPGTLFPASNETVATIPPIHKRPAPKWEFGLMGSAGVSRLTQSSLFQLNGWLGAGALSQEKNKAEDLAQRSGANYSPNGPNPNNPLINTAPPPRKQAAAITQGLSWSAAAFVQRPLSRRVRLTIGLQYTYMSAHTTIGKLVEQPVVVSQAYTSGTVVNRYYTSLDALQMGNGLSPNSQLNLATIPRDSLAGRNYTYRFHAIELPVTINWQINKGRQLPPFVLDAGISIGKLLSTDALHYDGRGDIYYKDNSLFNKTQVNALMGLNVGLFQQSKLPIWIGPHLRYSLTGLIRKEVSNGQYLWSTGIQVKMLLNRL